MPPDKKPKWAGDQRFRGKRPFHKPPARSEQPDDDIVRLFGIHAVEAALENPARKFIRMLATENAERRLKPALEAAIGRGALTIERTTPRDLDRDLGSDTVHQGVLLECDHLPEPELDDLVERAAHEGPLIVLDQVTDPHNVGAILRSAAVFGASGLIMTRRHSPPLNGTLAKSASGALEKVPVALVQNLAKALEALKESGATILGLEGDANGALEAETFSGPVALVFGAEGKGLRQLTGETCTRRVRISTSESFASLNVSNAAAIALHTALLKRSPGK